MGNKLIDTLKECPLSSAVLLIRHGEKDLSNGRLSEEGIVKCKDFAKELSKLNCHINIISSPESRCLETAKIIAETVGVQSINQSSSLGKPGLQIKDEEIYLRLYEVNRCRDIYDAWKNGEHTDCLFSPIEISERINLFLQEECTSGGLTLLISQSGTVGFVAYSLGLREYDVKNDEWVEYLDGVIIKK